MIKYLYVFITILILSFGIYSCDSSLGYDPNVQITKVNKDSTENTPDTTINKEVIFNIDSIRFTDFKEIVFVKEEHEPGPPKPKTLDWTSLLLSKNIRIDTSEKDIKLWLDLEVINPESDFLPKYKNILDRVLGFNISFAAIVNKPSYSLNDGIKNNKWFALSVKSIPQNHTTQFNGKQIVSQIVFLEDNRELGFIKIALESTPYDFMHNDIKVERFSGIIWLYYKKQ